MEENKIKQKTEQKVNVKTIVLCVMFLWLWFLIAYLVLFSPYMYLLLGLIWNIWKFEKLSLLILFLVLTLLYVIKYKKNKNNTTNVVIKTGASIFLYFIILIPLSFFLVVLYIVYMISQHSL
jgi:hypothetical protein